jgi:predicted ArsR family transcriptional regulator
VGTLTEILEVLESKGPQGPGDVVAALNTPRYKVLAAFHCLEELGLIVPLYSKGTYKIFQISETGRQVLKLAKEEGGLASAIEDLIVQRIEKSNNVTVEA